MLARLCWSHIQPNLQTSSVVCQSGDVLVMSFALLAVAGNLTYNTLYNGTQLSTVSSDSLEDCRKACVSYNGMIHSRFYMLESAILCIFPLALSEESLLTTGFF